MAATLAHLSPLSASLYIHSLATTSSHVAPPTHGPFVLVHPMETRSFHGIFKPIVKLNLHVDIPSLVPRNCLPAFKDPNWLNVMKDKHDIVSN